MTESTPLACDMTAIPLALEFSVEISPQHGPVSLRLSRPPGAAAFLRSELGIIET
ncbi:MAG: hypothetical protein ABIZ36_12500 [Gemmatimonadaceae bacterium]